MYFQICAEELKEKINKLLINKHYKKIKQGIQIRNIKSKNNSQIIQNINNNSLEITKDNLEHININHSISMLKKKIKVKPKNKHKDKKELIDPVIKVFLKVWRLYIS